MNRLRQYLWKEWRDNRAIALGILVAVPALVALATFFLPDSLASDPLYVQVCAWATLAITILALGSDLVPAETRRGRMAFLARLPADLNVAFAAKVLLLMMAIVFSTAYGFAVGALFGGWPDSGMKVLGGPLLLVLCAAPWIFAVSCWLPRGALALPATALALALFALPFYLVLLWFPDFRPTDGDFVFWGGALALGAFAVAWVSFAHGYRFGRGFLSAGWRGLLATLVLVAPAYAYTGYRLHEWSTVDPQSESFRVRNFIRGQSGRYLFVNAHMLLREEQRVAVHALIVDTRDGSWRSVGGAGAVFRALEPYGYWDSATVVGTSDPSSGTKTAGSNYKRYWDSFYDTDTAEVFKSGWTDMKLPEVEERFQRGQSATLRGWRRQYPVGLGTRVWRGRELGIHDPCRDKVYPSLGPNRHVLVRPGRWLVRESGRYAEWKLHDPDTKKYAPAPKLSRYPGVLPDGRVITFHGANRWTVVDPDSGESTPIGVEFDGFNQLRSSWLFKVWQDNVASLMRLDPESLEFEHVADIKNGFEPVLVNEGFLWGREDECSIVRIDLDSGERKVIFPR